MYKFIIKHLLPSSGDKKWCLDLPADSELYELISLEKEGVHFQGWALFIEASEVEAYIRTANKSHYFPLNMQRPDVVEKVLNMSSSDHPQRLCGFSFTLPLTTNELVFGFRIDGWDYDHATLTVEGTLKVLEGKNGWLFLDNDSNNSVAQYQGQLLLSAKQLNAWISYLDDYYREASARQIKQALLISPAKEMILSEHYPLKKGSTTPIEQLLHKAQAKHAVLYPDSVFKQSRIPPLRTGDTHWSAHGAMLASVELLSTLGIDPGSAIELFSHDLYQERPNVGDLGNKLYPPRAARERFLTLYNYRKTVVYDNQLPNFGRVMLLKNADALHDAKCVLFGSSSSYSMMDYFSRLFTDIVFIHCAGNIDPSLLDFEKPQYVVAQTNARFVITAPTTNYALNSVIRTKMSDMDSIQQAQIIKQSNHWLSKRNTEQTGYYHQFLITDR